MFWLIFRLKPFSSSIKQHISILTKRKKDLMHHQNYWLCLSNGYKKSFEYARIELAISIIDFKIEIWKAILGINV